MSRRFVRFQTADGIVRYGESDQDQVVAFSNAPWLGGKQTADRFRIQDITLLAPVTPSKIVCVGLNYHAHVTASFSADAAPQQPLLFLKPPSSIIGPGDSIRLPKASERVDYEAELGVVIGRKATDVDRSQSLDCVFGYTCVNDVTARDLQKSDGQWARAKGFDTFCPVGPEIVTGLPYDQLEVRGIHNGEIKQSGKTSGMIFPIPFLISYISAVMTLLPGDLVITGTPSGIAPMKSGDQITVSITGIGELTNFVV